MLGEFIVEFTNANMEWLHIPIDHLHFPGIRYWSPECYSLAIQLGVAPSSSHRLSWVEKEDGSLLKDTHVSCPMACTFRRKAKDPRRAMRCPALRGPIARDFRENAPTSSWLFVPC